MANFIGKALNKKVVSGMKSSFKEKKDPSKNSIDSQASPKLSSSYIGKETNLRMSGATPVLSDYTSQYETGAPQKESGIFDQELKSIGKSPEKKHSKSTLREDLTHSQNEDMLQRLLEQRVVSQFQNHPLLAEFYDIEGQVSAFDVAALKTRLPQKIPTKYWRIAILKDISDIFTAGVFGFATSAIYFFWFKKDFEKFLEQYISTEEMEKIKGVSKFIGKRLIKIIVKRLEKRLAVRAFFEAVPVIDFIPWYTLSIKAIETDYLNLIKDVAEFSDSLMTFSGNVKTALHARIEEEILS